MKKGSIYKLYNEFGTYYGSTTKSLKDRLNRHKCQAKNKKCSSNILFQDGSIPKIELLEEVEFDDISVLRNREAYYIRNLECINKHIPGRTKKEWRDEHKKDRKNYYQNNKEKFQKKNKKHYEANKDIIIEKRKIKITCECGSHIRKSDFVKHCKSKKHQNFINSQNIVI
tara:strand:- start:223 stop:732 length:510 start_codon:yes stop_codon:yes gene_type:complete